MTMVQPTQFDSIPSTTTLLLTQVIPTLPIAAWKLVFDSLGMQEQARLKLVCKDFSDVIGNMTQFVRRIFEDLRPVECWEHCDVRYPRFARELLLHPFTHYSFLRRFYFGLEGNLLGCGGLWTPFLSKNALGSFHAASDAKGGEVEDTFSFPYVVINLSWNEGDEVYSGFRFQKPNSGFFIELRKQLAEEGHIFFLGACKLARDHNIKYSGPFPRRVLEPWEKIAANPALYSNKDIWEAGEAEYNRLQGYLKDTDKAVLISAINKKTIPTPVTMPDSIPVQRQVNVAQPNSSPSRVNQTHKKGVSTQVRTVAIQKINCLQWLWSFLKKIFCCQKSKTNALAGRRVIARS